MREKKKLTEVQPGEVFILPLDPSSHKTAPISFYLKLRDQKALNLDTYSVVDFETRHLGREIEQEVEVCPNLKIQMRNLDDQ